MTLRRNGLKILLGALLLSSLMGCLSPIAMHRAVIEYDRTVSYVEADLLLLNIARARYHRPVHFTAVSSVAATFDSYQRGNTRWVRSCDGFCGAAPESLNTARV